MTTTPVAENRRAFADEDAFAAFAEDESWSDGLPVVPPTPERVEAMVAASGLDPAAVVGEIPPFFAPATIEKVAANAVMAGCRPEYLPIVLTAIAAACEPEFGLFSAQATTHPCGFMVLVSGDAATEVGINSAGGCFGPGFRANATIGRAVRLAMQNVGGSHPQTTDLSTHGSPAKFTYCFAERVEESPWEPFHVSKGFPPDVSTVTVAAAEAPQNLNDHVSLTPQGLMVTFAHSIAVMGNNNAYCRDSDYFVVICPEHAALLDRAGWSRADVQRHLFERARIPYGTWKLGGMAGMIPQPAYLDAADDGLQLPLTVSPDDINVVVAGGGGRHSAFIPTQAAVGKSVTRVVGDLPVELRRRTGSMVRKFGGWGDVEDREASTSSAPSTSGPDPDLRSRVGDLVELLDADGYDLDLAPVHGGVHVAVAAREGACEDCLVPPAVFRGIVADRLTESGFAITEDRIDVSYPPGAHGDT